jgi:lipopolysaccharide assembly protein A
MLFIFGLLLGAVMVVFVLQNTMPVSVAFFGWHFDSSLALILILAILGGMLVSALVSLPEIINKNFKLSRLARENRQLASELETHREKLIETEARLDERPPVEEVRQETIVRERADGDLL